MKTDNPELASLRRREVIAFRMVTACIVAAFAAALYERWWLLGLFIGAGLGAHHAWHRTCRRTLAVMTADIEEMQKDIPKPIDDEHVD